MNKMADLRVLVETMQTVSFGINEQIIYRVPVGLWLLSDVEKARQVITERLLEIAPQSHPAALRYKRFAKELRSRLDK